MVGQFISALREAPDLFNGEGRITTNNLQGLQKRPEPVNRLDTDDVSQSFFLILLRQENAIRDNLNLFRIMLDACSPILNVELLLEKVQRGDLVGFGRGPRRMKRFGLDH